MTVSRTDGLQGSVRRPCVAEHVANPFGGGARRTVDPRPSRASDRRSRGASAGSIENQVRQRRPSRGAARQELASQGRSACLRPTRRPRHLRPLAFARCACRGGSGHVGRGQTGVARWRVGQHRLRCRAAGVIGGRRGGDGAGGLKDTWPGGVSALGKRAP